MPVALPISALFALVLMLAPTAASAQAPPCGSVFADRDGDGRQGHREKGLAGVAVSDGLKVERTDARGRFALRAGPGRTLFVIKPAGFAVPMDADALPVFWRHGPATGGARPRFGGVQDVPDPCPAFALRPQPSPPTLDVLVFADPQPKSAVDVDHYRRDIIEPLLATRGDRPLAHLGLSLGDIVDDDLTLYPAMRRQTARLGVPWLHVAGNHDLDFDVARDEESLQTFRQNFGPDTFTWEEPQATFVLLDDVIYRPGQRPIYVGGLREEQFGFLESYLAGVDARRLLVIALHIPLFPEGGRETFRTADRERLFSLLARFSNVLVLSGHGHVQRHVFHEASTGWTGARPLHEYNVGAISGAFWSGVKDASGVPDATMADGTPNGHARLRVDSKGSYRLSWHPARLATTPDTTTTMALHAPRVLRRGAYPAWGVYANVFMGRPDSRVEYRIDGGEWKPMTRVERPDPRLLAENVRDDDASRLRGFDRSPEAQPSTHLWRGALPTDLAPGSHRVEVRAFDPWTGVQQASTQYRLEEARP